jgi:hypothetical protein
MREIQEFQKEGIQYVSGLKGQQNSKWGNGIIRLRTADRTDRKRT